MKTLPLLNLGLKKNQTLNYLSLQFGSKLKISYPPTLPSFNNKTHTTDINRILNDTKEWVLRCYFIVIAPRVVTLIE